MTHQPVHFHEQQYCVREIERHDERIQAYRLRHVVFCEQLHWVLGNPERLDIDQYDTWATSLGIFEPDCNQRLVATLRLLPADRPFMLEQEFSSLVLPGVTLRKEPDTTEITRFAILPELGADCAQTVCMLLYKAWYQWSLKNRIRYVYLEVETRYWRKLRMIGFPCTPLGPSRRVAPAGADSVALLLDWEEFRAVNRFKRPAWLEWMSTARSIPLASPRPRRGLVSRLGAYLTRLRHETAPSVR